jgi:hypothetical protein
VSPTSQAPTPCSLTPTAGWPIDLNAEGKEHLMSDDELGLLDPMGGPPEDMEDVEPWWQTVDDPDAPAPPPFPGEELEEGSP